MKGSQIGIIGGGIVAVVIIAILFVSMGTQNNTTPLPSDLDVTIPTMDSKNDVDVSSEDKLLVYTTFYPLYQFTQGVAGDAADVRILISANGDPHASELGPKTIVALTKADMVISNGVNFEPYIDEIMSASDFEHIVFVDSSEGIELMEGEAHDHSSHGSHGNDKHDDHSKEDGHDEHTEDFYNEIEHVVEEFEHGHITQSQSIEEIEEILSEHEGDGHGHEDAIEDIEHLIHEIEDGHIDGVEGLEEIHHLVSGEDVHDDHSKEDVHDERGEEGGIDHTYDPHIWLDPILAKAQVMTIADHLKESDPTHAEIYHDNAISYANQLDQLDQEIRSEVSSCAKDTFVPFHNSFSYFAERYNLNTLAVIQEFSPETPVTAKDIEELIRFAEDNNIKYFLTEENRNPKLAERLAAELGGDILLFSPLESLSESDDPNVTYFEKMRQNVDNLQIALECN
jgi:zinc transport system substrate-binding protein